MQQEYGMPKNPNLTLDGPDLAALLCSRVCHDVISPVGAINNGLELLDEGAADSDALDLIRTSALNASVRLKFARLAFGASGSVGASIDTGEAEKAAKDFAAAEKKTEVSWNGPRAIIPKNRVKLLLNLFLVAYAGIPRGGSVDVTLENPEETARFVITVKGRMMRVPPKFIEISTGVMEEAVDAHSIQPYYTVLLAEECGMDLSYVVSEDKITFIAEVAAAQPAEPEASDIVRKVGKRILSELGFLVVEAGGSTEALMRCQAELPNFLIVDAGLDGALDLIAGVRGLPNGKSVRIFYCVIEADLKKMMAGKRAGADDFLLKPFDRKILTSVFSGYAAAA
eukprot:g7628.t1